MSIRRLGLGLMLLIGAMYFMGKVKFGAIFKMLFFLTGLAGVLKLFRSKGPAVVNKVVHKKFEVTGLFGLAIGLSILILSIDMVSGIDWNSAGALIFFIAGLGLTIAGLNKVNKSGVSPFSDMLSMGIGLSLLIVVMALVGDISWGGVFKLIGFILGLGIAIAITSALINKFGGGSRARIPGIRVGLNVGTSGMFGFAMGLAVLVLTIAAVGELDWGPAFKLLGFIVLLGFAIGLPGLISKSSNRTSGMMGFSFGIAILVLTIAATSELDWKPAWKLLAFIAGIGLVTRLLKPDNITSMKTVAFAIGIMAISLWALSKVNITYEQIATIGLTLGVFLGVLFLASKMKMKITQGSLMLLVVAGTSLVLATALWAISKMAPDPMQMVYFIGAIVGLTLAFWGLSFILPFAMAGAGMAITLGLATLLIAAPLMMIQGLTFENVGAFLLAIGGLAVGLFLLLPQLTIAVLSGALLIVVGLSVLIFAGALMAIMELEITDSKMQGFNDSLRSLMKTFSSFGLVETAKAALKAAALVPIILVSLGAAVVLKAIQDLDVSETKIGAFGIFLGKFVNVTTDEIIKAEGSLKKATPGLDALSKLVNIGSDLAKLIVSFSNMNYNEYAVKDGKLQIVSVRKITDVEIAQVGVNVGKLVQGLLNPLMAMAGDGEYWDFGNGMKVLNPFKGGLFGDNNKGVDRMGKIGEAFKPLIDSIATFGSLSMSQDPKMLENFKLGLGGSITTLTDVFEKLENWKNKNAPKSIENINTLITSLSALDSFKSMSDSMDKLLGSLADDDKWGKINKNLSTLNENIGAIVKNINTIDIKKALALENNLKLMTEKTSSENLKLVVENLKQMIGLVVEGQQQQTQIIQAYSPMSSIPEPVQAQQNNNSVLEDIKALMEKLNEGLSGTNSKLSGKLKVQVVGANDSNLVGG